MANSFFLREYLFSCLVMIIAIAHHRDEVTRFLTKVITFTSPVSIDRKHCSVGAFQNLIASFVTSRELQE